MQKSNKVAIVGCGKVGMTAAFSILHGGLVNELLLVGRNLADIEGEQLDLEHGISFLHSAQVSSTTNYADLKDSDVVIFTAGASQKPGETRLDLTAKNLAILEDIIPKIVQYAPEAIVLIVTNPVDILTYKACQLAKLPKGRVFGSGTTLDTSRFRFHLSEFLHVNPRSIHSYILGEHGDSSFPVLSSASVGGQPLMTMSNFSHQKAMKAFEKAKDAAYKIIQSKGATYYAIGAVVAHIVRTILSDAKSILPVSVPLHNYQGFSGVALSVPCVVGRNGVEEMLEIKMSWEEKRQLEQSVRTLRGYLG
jgi:L-lactate dehydrogenase